MASKSTRVMAPALLLLCLLWAGCSSVTNRISSLPPGQLDISLDREDYEVISDVKGTASVTNALLIFQFGAKKQSGTIVGMATSAGGGGLPLVGGILGGLGGGLSVAEKNAVYNAIKSVEGADALIFPRFETERSGLPLLFMKETVTVRAKAIRLKTGR